LRMSGDATPAVLGGRSVGIDLGTTNSAVAAVVDGRPKILVNIAGESTTPSVVAFTGDKILVGAEAVEQANQNPANTFSSVKRVIGRKHKEAGKAVADPSLLSRLVDGPDGQVALKCKELARDLLPQEVSTHVIRRLLDDAERELGEKVTRAVITVPAYFNDAQREATEAAGLLAGLEKVKLLREPEAAAMAYGLEKLEDELILVFDLGGGTLDVSVLEVGAGIIEVIWTGGDAFLGGDDFDKAIADGVASKGAVFSRLKGNDDDMRRLLADARQAKVRLSSAKSVAIAIPGTDNSVDVTARQMEDWCRSLIQRLALPVRQVALMAGIGLDGELMGEISRAPPDDVGDTGAKTDYSALKKQQQAGRKNSKARNQKKLVLKEVQKQVPQGRGGAGGGGKLRAFPAGTQLSEVVLVGGATRMPAVIRTVQTLTGIAPRKTIDPDEAVALGAAIQAGVMDGTITGVEVLSPLQAALLRGFARKKLQEEEGTYSPLMGDPEEDEADDGEWSEDEEGEEGEDEEWDDDEEWMETADIAGLEGSVDEDRPDEK